MIKQLENFRDAYNELLKAWAQDDSFTDLKAIELYPFNKSFDELEVNEWINQSIKELISENKDK